MRTYSPGIIIQAGNLLFIPEWILAPVEMRIIIYFNKFTQINGEDGVEQVTSATE